MEQDRHPLFWILNAHNPRIQEMVRKNTAYQKLAGDREFDRTKLSSFQELMEAKNVPSQPYTRNDWRKVLSQELSRATSGFKQEGRLVISNSISLDFINRCKKIALAEGKNDDEFLEFTDRLLGYLLFNQYQIPYPNYQLGVVVESNPMYKFGYYLHLLFKPIPKISK